MAKRKNTSLLVRELVEPIAEELGLSLWDVRFEKEGSDWHLSIIIDKDGSVSMDDCEKLSRIIDPLLDEMDPTDHPYYLIVSSPGIGRLLKTDAHLNAYIEQDVRVRLIRPDENKERDFVGVLTAFDADTITLDDNKTIIRKETASIKAADEYWEEF